MNKNRFTASLHTHVRSLNDAHIPPEALCDRIIELGGKGIAVTDHGVLSSIEDYRRVFADKGLKLIPGCELYVDGGILGRQHLIVLAVNDHGYKGICKVVTESNKNVNDDHPVISRDQLFNIVKEYTGDIICTTACMNGVICSIYLLNGTVMKKIEKLQEKQKAYIAPDDARVRAVKNRLKDAENALESAKLERDNTKRVAEQKFSKRETAIKKAEKAGNPVDTLKAELEADKKAASEATKKLESLKEGVKKATKALSANNKALKDVMASVSKYEEYQMKIDTLKKELKDDAELEIMAEKELLAYADAFGRENIYVEVQNHGIPEEGVCYPKVSALARRLNIPIVATNDVHILTGSKDERLKRQILRSMRFGNFEEERVGDSELYLKDDAELAETIGKILPEDVVTEAINNIEVIFSRCDVEFKTGTHYPVFKKGADADKLLDEEIAKGKVERFPEGMPEGYEERLSYELSIIKKMGYSNYHLVVKDFLEYGRLLGYVPKDRLEEAPLTIEELKEFIAKNGWKNPGFTIGPGRGSAVGSLACYLLGITALDPIKYGLLFERFLNPERVSMPDIDSDFGNTIRGKVIDFVKNKYGQMAVCGIMTLITQAPKGAIKTAAKYYGLKEKGEPMTSLGNIISGEVSKEPNVAFNTLVGANGEPDEDGIPLYDFLMEKHSEDKDAKEIIRWAKLLEGAFTAYGAHAAGIVIPDNDDVSEYIPLRMNKKLGMLTSQMDMVQIEENGLLKFDFLGLKTVDIINDTLHMIECTMGKIIDPLKIDLEDKAVYREIIAAAKTDAIFQLESPGMKNLNQRFKASCFEDLLIPIAMFRPGPIQFLDDVIAVKNGEKPVSYLTPELEPILSATYGAIVYQEQVMQICQSLAGFTLGHADQVRRYMSKKKADKLAKERTAFVEGCASNGIKEAIANKLFDQMMAFAAYAFNKSHAAAYALNAYLTAWLKYYYPAEFFASALNWATSEKLPGLMYAAAQFKVDVLTPDINIAGKDFTVSDGKIRFGLGSVAGVKNHADEIIEERMRGGRFTSLQDFLIRVRPNTTVIQNLISAGAFDSFAKNRKAMKLMAEDMKELVSKKIKKQALINSAEALLPVIEKLTGKDAVIKAQTDMNLKAEITECLTANQLQTRLDNARDALKEVSEQLDSIKLKNVAEDKNERIALEKEYLGNYVTAHPMDYYPKAEDIDVKMINTLTSSDKKAYGVITKLDIKHRKSDGAKMAVFTLEDRTGDMEVVMFTKPYSYYGNVLEEGKVVLLSGTAEVEETETEDSEDTQVKVKFFAEKVEAVNQKKSTIVLPVSSMAAFHLDVEEAFKERYADESGHPLVIYDMAMDEMRVMNYTVSGKVLSLPNAEELF